MSTLKLRIKGVFFLLGRKPFSLEGNSHHLGKTSLKRHLFHLATSKMPVHQKGSYQFQICSFILFIKYFIDLFTFTRMHISNLRNKMGIQMDQIEAPAIFSRKSYYELKTQTVTKRRWYSGEHSCLPSS